MSIETPKYSPEERQHLGSQRGGEVRRALRADELQKTESGQYLASKKYIEKAKGEFELSPEDFAEMLDQIPALKEMLQEREIKLSELEKGPNANAQEVGTLRVEIEELRQEISEREELLGE